MTRVGRSERGRYSLQWTPGETSVTCRTGSTGLPLRAWSSGNLGRLDVPVTGGARFSDYQTFIRDHVTKKTSNRTFYVVLQADNLYSRVGHNFCSSSSECLVMGPLTQVYHLMNAVL